MLAKMGRTAVALLIGLSPAIAQGVPRYAIDDECKGIAGFGGSYSHSIYGACISQEQGAYDRLTAGWAAVPSEIQKSCDEISRFGGHGSYNILLTCINQELGAAQQNATRAFRY